MMRTILTLITVAASFLTGPGYAQSGPCTGPRTPISLSPVTQWDAEIARWPGFVALRVRIEHSGVDKSVYFCGGAAIHPNWVVTAAHCVHDAFDGRDKLGYFQTLEKRYSLLNIQGNAYLEVISGRDNLADAVGQSGYRVRRIIIHPGYVDAFEGNDIALLELESNQPFAGPLARVSVSRFLDPPDDLPVSVMAVGYGRAIDGPLLPFPPTGTIRFYAMSDRPHETALPTGRVERCENSAQWGKFNALSQLCAAQEKYGGRDTCTGDSGGPLVVFDTANCPYIVGLTSYGASECGRVGVYGIYTRVSFYTDWIKTHVPTLDTTERPQDTSRFPLRRAAIAAIDRIEAIYGETSRRISVRTCQRSDDGKCVESGDLPLLANTDIEVDFDLQPRERAIVFVITSQGVIRQFRPVGEIPVRPIGLHTIWTLDDGRLIVLSVPDNVVLPQVTYAQEKDGWIDDVLAYLLAYLNELAAEARQNSSRIGLLKFAVRQ